MIDRSKWNFADYAIRIIITLVIIWIIASCCSFIIKIWTPKETVIIDSPVEEVELKLDLPEYKYEVGIYVYEGWKPNERLTPEKFFEKFSLVVWYIDNEAVARIKFKDGKVEFEGDIDKVFEVMATYGDHLMDGFSIISFYEGIK